MTRKAKSKDDKKTSSYEKASYIFIGLGFIVLLFGICIFIKDETLWKGSLNSGKVGQFGDFIGGTVGILWALAGVILIYSNLKKQQKAIEIQENELQAQRREYTLSRITSVAIKTLENMEREFDNFTIEDEQSNLYEGQNAFDFLSNRLDYLSENANLIYDEDGKNPVLEEEFRNKVGDGIELLNREVNKDSLKYFIKKLNTFVKTYIVLFDDIDDELFPEVLRIKLIIRESIGSERVEVLRIIKDYLEIYGKHLSDIHSTTGVLAPELALLYKRRFNEVLNFFDNINEEEE